MRWSRQGNEIGNLLRNASMIGRKSPSVSARHVPNRATVRDSHFVYTSRLITAVQMVTVAVHLELRPRTTREGQTLNDFRVFSNGISHAERTRDSLCSINIRHKCKLHIRQIADSDYVSKL